MGTSIGDLARRIDAKIHSCITKRGNLGLLRLDYPKYLPEETRKFLLDSLMPVAESAFQQTPDRDFRKDVEEHVFSSDGLLIVISDEGVPVAFRMWDHIVLNFVAGTDILYLAGMCVHRDWQCLGIGEALLQYVLRNDIRRSMPDEHAFAPLPLAPYVALRTQNPVMKCCFDRAIGMESYPRLDDDVIPTDIAYVGQKVSDHLGDMHFDSKVMMSRGLYGHSLYGRPPVPPNNNYARLFARLNAEQGDAMVCVWRRQTAH